MIDQVLDLYRLPNMRPVTIAIKLGISKDEVNKIIDNYIITQINMGINKTDIRRNLNITKDNLINRMRKYGLVDEHNSKLGSRRLSSQVKEKILLLHLQNATVAEISNKIGYAKITITLFLKSNNLVPNKTTARKYNSANIPQNFDNLFRFDTLSASESYLLGFISSDGNVTKNLKSFSVFSRDKDIIEKLHTLIHGSLYTKQVMGKPFYTAHSLTNERVCKKLLQYGITPNKSLTIRLPVNCEYSFKDYLRGVFDGDGHISKQSDNKSFLIGLTSGSKEFLVDIANKIMEYIPEITKYSLHGTKQSALENTNGIIYDYTDHIVYRLIFYGDKAKTILQFMYQNCNHLYMQRKYQKAIDCINGNIYKGYK